MNHTNSSPSEILKSKRILLAHSNAGAHKQYWHRCREDVARRLGYDLTTFCITDLHPYTIFPYLDRKWRRRDSVLMRLYDTLGEKIMDSDVFIHYNGALIHPEFLAQFKQLKIYHCADDPDASKVISQPVAHGYDIHAISNPACIPMYQSWGCKRVFFWPIGAYHYVDGLPDHVELSSGRNRDIPLVFVGSKYGTTRFRFVGRIPILNQMSWPYHKKSFFADIEHNFPFIHGYGSGWRMGRIVDANIPDLYSRARIGLNVHNSLGPINGRMYDLAAFGVCQICDNKKHLHHVFEDGKEIIGFDTTAECIEHVRYYLAHPEEARAISQAGRQRYLRDYTMEAIWHLFFNNVNKMLH